MAVPGSIAAAEAAAAADEVEEEFQLQLSDSDDDAEAQVDPSQFDERGFGFIMRGGKTTLYQVKSNCGAMHLCSKTGAFLSLELRCETCGYATHFSCQKMFHPTLPFLKKNRICLACVDELGLKEASFVSGRRARAVDPNSNMEDLKAVLDNEAWKVPLELITQAKFNKLRQEDEDSVHSVVVESSSSSSDDMETESEEEIGKFVIGYSKSKHLANPHPCALFRIC